MGSASELDYLLLLCREFHFIADDQYELFSKELIRVRKMLSGLLAGIEAQLEKRTNAAGA
jgi:four helix bundle protein